MEVEQCEATGGIVCAAGQICPNGAWLDETQRCCADSCLAGSCSAIGGNWCDRDQVCTSQDLTDLVGDYVGRSDPNQLCCFGSSPADACRDTGSSDCTPTSPDGTEDKCNDGVDNDCDGKIDYADVSANDLYDDCGATVSGRVYDQDNLGIGELHIRAYNENGDIAEGISRSDGRYTIYSVSAGAYTVQVESSRYQSDPRSAVMVQRGRATAGIDFQVILRESGSLSGKVLDEDGNALRDAVVRLIDTPYSTKTDPLGNYVFNGLETQKRYRAMAFKTGYSRSPEYAFSVSAGEAADHDFLLSPFSCAIDRPAPVISDIRGMKGMNQVKLSWSIPNDCEPYVVRIYRCDDTLQNCTREPLYSLRGSVHENNTFTDRYLLWDKHYTYHVAAFYTQGAPDSQAVFSDPRETYSGNSICAGRMGDDQFCIVDEYVDGGYYCDDQNHIQQAYDEEGLRVIDCTLEGWTCSETIGSLGKVQTMCVEEIDCPADERARPFGMYFTRDLCQVDEDGAHRPCYFDHSRTNVDSCFDCDIGMTCADYHSEAACEENHCEIIEGGVPAECMWEWTNEELGIGICTDSQRDLCSFCANPISRVFAMCDQETCFLLGDCHFVESEGVCEGCQDVTCYDYTTETACMPDSMPALDSSDNSLIAESGDACRIGSCLWQQGRCMKDANANGKDDCGPEDFSYVSSTFQASTCRGDRYAANTTIVMPTRFNPVDENITVTFFAFDSEWNVRQKAQTVWFCIQPEGSTRCQNTRTDYDQAIFDPETGLAAFMFSGLRIRPGQWRQEFLLAPGNNVIRYYSLDWANNPETVQKYSFYVDLIGPEINISSMINPLPRQDDKPQMSDVTLIATLDEPAKCTMNLRGCDAIGNCETLDEGASELDAFIPQHHRTVSSIEDGIYTAEVTCVDVLGNENTATEEIIVDADPRAFDPRPRGAVDVNEVELSVKSVEAVYCRYTTDINARFDDIPSDQQMERIKTGSYYTHTAVQDLSASRPYIYYFVCNYEPVSREVVHFSVDQVAPVLALQESWGDPYDFSKWHIDGEVYPVCTDEPLGGFGCGEIRYCVENLESYLPEAEKTNCDPDIVLADNEHISLDVPQRLCVLAQEETMNGMGGKNSSLQCNDILIDLFAPYLMIESFPTSTRQNSISISGTLSDIHYMKDSWSLSQVGSSPNLLRFVERMPNTYLVDFDLYLDLGIKYAEEERPRFSLLFAYEEGQYYAATVDASDPDAHMMRLEKKVVGSPTPEILAELPIEFVSQKKYPVHIGADDGQLAFGFGPYMIESEDDAYLGAGYVGAQTYRMGDRNPSISIGNIRIDDHNIYAENELAVKKDGHLAHIAKTRGDFSVSIPLSDGTLAHGQGFTIELTGKDLADRSSNTVEKTVYYDIEGPEIANVTFIPTENNGSYVEYLTDAEVVVRVHDDYSDVMSVTVVVMDQAVDLTEGEKGWTGRFPSRNLYIGKHDVTVLATDEAGNEASRTFIDTLFVDDRLNPVIQFEFAQPYKTKDLNPRLTVNTTEESICEVIYVDADNVERTVEFDNPGARRHSVVFTYDLPHEEHEETFVEAFITCHDASGNPATKQAEIIVDYRPPIIGAKGNDYDLLLRGYDRGYKQYDVYTRSDRALLVVADEAVKCKYADQQVPYAEMQGTMSNYDADLVKREDHVRIGALGEGTHTYYILCEDFVGNIADVMRSVIFDVDYAAPPEMVNVSPTAYSKDPYPRFRLTTMRPLFCTGVFNGAKINFDRSGSGPYEHVSRERYNLMDGSYMFSLTCGSGPEGMAAATEQYAFIKDTQAPLVELEDVEDGEDIDAASMEIQFRIRENNGNSVDVTILNEDVVVWQGTVPVGSSVAREVPVRFGSNRIRVLAEDQAGNVGESAVRINKGERTVDIRLQGLIQGSTTGGIETIHAKLHNTDAGMPDRISMTLHDYQQNLVAGETTFSGSHASFAIQEPLEAGRYTVRARAYADGALVAYDSTTFTIDTLAEELDVRSPQDLSVSFSPIRVNGTIQYQNVIIWRDFVLKNTHSAIKQVFEIFSASAPLDEGVTPVYIGFENEIGHRAYVDTVIMLDRKGPIATVTLKGGGATAIGPRPRFEARFSEPARIQDVFVIASDVAGDPEASRIDVKEEYEDIFYLDQEFSMAEPLPEEGLYQFGIQLEDTAGNIAATQYFEFNYIHDPFGIRIVDPEFLVSPTKQVNFTISTDREATCRFETQDVEYAIMRPFTETGGFNHSVSITLPEELRKIPYYIKCDDGIGNINEDDPALFNITYDTTAPEIEDLFISPGVEGVIVEYPLMTHIYAKTDEEARCRYGTGADFEGMSDFDGFSEPFFNLTSVSTMNGLEDETTYTYNIICQNRAKRLSTMETIEYSVSLSQSGDIRVVSPKNNEYYTTTTLPIKLITNKRALAGNCKWGLAEDAVHSAFEETTNQDHVHTVGNHTFPQGDNSLYFECLIEGDIKKQSVHFVVDTTPPEFVSIDDGEVTWKTDELAASFEFTDNESGIDRYEYAIGKKIVNGVNPPEEWQSELEPEFTKSDQATAEELNLSDLTNYYWAVRAYNKAGLHSNWYASDGIRIDTSGAPVIGSCTDGQKNQDETDIDCGGLLCTPCSEGRACVVNEDCITRICTDGMCVSGACSNGAKDGNETDTDCGGGSCPACDLGQACRVNDDCLHRYCEAGVCMMPACDDGIFNGFETDIDCGGDNECPRCADNKTCIEDTDCLSGSCGDDGRCLAASCSDGLFNGKETDVDCGGDCNKCGEGKGCELDSDCTSDYCLDGRCADRDLKDTDGDGMPDWYELKYGLDIHDPDDAEFEAVAQDGLTNLQKYEYRYHEMNKNQEPLDPTRSDFDDDGHPDKREIQKATDATDSSDYPQAKWWSIILLLLVLVIVGGALGYFGYTRFMTKQHPQGPVHPPLGMMPPRPQMPPMPKKHKMTLKEKMRLALKDKILEERKEQMRKEHEGITKNFSERQQTQHTESQTPGDSRPKIQSLKKKIAEKAGTEKTGQEDAQMPEQSKSSMDALKNLSKKPPQEPATSDGSKAVDKLSEIIQGTEKDIESKKKKTETQKDVLEKLKGLKNEK